MSPEIMRKFSQHRTEDDFWHLGDQHGPICPLSPPVICDLEIFRLTEGKPSRQ